MAEVLVLFVIPELVELQNGLICHDRINFVLENVQFHWADSELICRVDDVESLDDLPICSC